MTRVDRLCVVWSVVLVVFFSISQSKLPAYIPTVTVPCSILVARLFSAAMGHADGAAACLVRRAALVFAGSCLVLAVVAGAGSSHATLLARTLRISVTDAETLAPCATPLVVSLAVFGVGALVAWYRRHAGLCFLCLALFSPVFFHVN